MQNEIVRDAKQRMDKSVEAIRDELAKIRTGKATPALLEPVKVDAYGGSMPLSQVATISTPDPRLLTVQPWDKTLINEIEKGILKADLGLNPANDGQIIRVPIPPLNEERRKEFVRICRKVTEEGRIAVRNIRRDANDHLKKSEKEHDLSEDQAHTLMDEIQKVTDAHIKNLDDILKLKEAEIMEV